MALYSKHAWCSVNRAVWQTIWETPGGVHRETFIAGKRQFLSLDEVLNPLYLDQEVCVVNNAFDGLIGTILSVNSGDRVWVLLDMLKQSTKVTIPRDGLVTV